MVTVEQAALTDETAAQLIELSARWVEEDCSWGMVVNTRDDLKEPLFVARDGERVVGYAFGHFYTQEKRTSGIPAGSRCFDVDELYVLPEYRSGGVGRALFRRLGEAVEGEAEFITLVTSTKDYRRILAFYVDELGMDFHNAFLFRRIK